MTTRTITGHTKAWLTEYADPETLVPAANPNRVVGDNLAYSNSDMKGVGWTLVGEATITVVIPDERTLVESKVESLRAEQQKTLADAQAKATQIEGQIQNLLAISWDGATGEGA